MLGKLAELILFGIAPLVAAGLFAPDPAVAEEQSGFAVANHHTMFAGTCPACRYRQASERRATAVR